ncbi:MAG: hypothetical protein DRO01_03500 [Thermoproteota archaeon]|nr:MAG: hypothetical protein DRO01_03500 [Candidatus Korarchaeota archaeon]
MVYFMYIRKVYISSVYILLNGENLMSQVSLEDKVRHTVMMAREYAEVFLKTYTGDPVDKDRLYTLFEVAEDPRNPYSAVRIVCPLCGWVSKPLYFMGTRFEWMNTVARVLGVHLHKKHDWKKHFEIIKSPRIYDGINVIAIEQRYICRKCRFEAQNLLLSVLHYLTHEKEE